MVCRPAPPINYRFPALKASSLCTSACNAPPCLSPKRTGDQENHLSSLSHLHHHLCPSSLRYQIGKHSARPLPSVLREFSTCRKPPKLTTHAPPPPALNRLPFSILRPPSHPRSHLASSRSIPKASSTRYTTPPHLQHQTKYNVCPSGFHFPQR